MYYKGIVGVQIHVYTMVYGWIKVTPLHVGEYNTGVYTVNFANLSRK